MAITKVRINGVEVSRVRINGGVWFQKSDSSGGEDIDYNAYLEALRENIYNYQTGSFNDFWTRYYNEYAPSAPANNGATVWQEIESHGEQIDIFKKDPIYQECLINGIYIDQTQKISNLITSLEDDLDIIKQDYETRDWGKTNLNNL